MFVNKSNMQNFTILGQPIPGEKHLGEREIYKKNAVFIGYYIPHFAGTKKYWLAKRNGLKKDKWYNFFFRKKYTIWIRQSTFLPTSWFQNLVPSAIIVYHLWSTAEKDQSVSLKSKINNLKY